jgi:hypothetical protein
MPHRLRPTGNSRSMHQSEKQDQNYRADQPAEKDGPSQRRAQDDLRTARFLGRDMVPLGRRVDS